MTTTPFLVRRPARPAPPSATARAKPAGRAALQATTRTAAALAFAAAASVGAAPAGGPAEPPAPGGVPGIVIADGQGGLAVAVAGALMARAQEAGRLPVIVGLEAGFRPEGEIGPAAARAQRDGIAAAQSRLIAALDAPANVTAFATIPFVSMLVGPDDLARLLALPGVTSIAEDVALAPALNESTRVINAHVAWRNGITGQGQAVAVLDSGTQLNHNAFTGAIISGACFSRAVEGVSVSLCPNGEDSQFGLQAGRACSPINLAMCDHGTHVAGIAMGDRRHRQGVAHGAQLISIQVFHRRDDAAGCAPVPVPCIQAYTSDIIRGLERVLRLDSLLDVPIAAVNVSIGGGSTYARSCDTVSPAMVAAIGNLRSRGIATVVASGNNGINAQMGFPACLSPAISVGSSTKDDNISTFSNHAAGVTLIAPGSDISAPWYRRVRNRVTEMSGTSMAAPHVAGAFAVLRQNHPDSSVGDIVRALTCTGQPVSRVFYPRPRIDVNAARRFLQDPAMRRLWTFSNPRQVDQWRADIGTWFAMTNRMRVRADQNNFFYKATSPFCAENVEVEAELRRDDPATGSFHFNSGLWLASTIDQNKHANGMWFAYNKAWGGTAVIWASEGIALQGTTTSGAGRLLCQNTRATVHVGRPNAMRVVMRDGAHSLYLNGELACETADRTFSAGNVAVMMAAPRSSPDHMLDVRRVEARALPGGSGILPTARAPGTAAFVSAPEGGALEPLPGETMLGIPAR